MINDQNKIPERLINLKNKWNTYNIEISIYKDDDGEEIINFIDKDAGEQYKKRFFCTNKEFLQKVYNFVFNKENKEKLTNEELLNEIEKIKQKTNFKAINNLHDLFLKLDTEKILPDLERRIIELENDFFNIKNKLPSYIKEIEFPDFSTEDYLESDKDHFEHLYPDYKVIKKETIDWLYKHAVFDDDMETMDEYTERMKKIEKELSKK